jgi:NAD(P)-dependent dehydrogenase (short-subunit alcohol dehydrogenase family)
VSRVAIVTGAGTGIGAAAARALVKEGLRVALVGRRLQPLQAVADELGDTAVCIAADVGDSTAAQAIVTGTLDALGRIDVVVNNAAMIRTGPLESITRELFDAHYAVNVAGPLFLLSAALPALRVAETPSVINIGSSLGSILMPDTMLYGSTKAALEYLTRAWAHELAADQIRVNCVAPGPTRTPIHATYSEDLAATYADLDARIPLKRMGQPEDVATWVAFLASAQTAWTTGNVIHVDGGQVLGRPDL